MNPLIRQRKSGILLTLLVAFWTGSLQAQTVTLQPDEVVNGIEPLSGDQYHQRFDITLGGTAGPATRAFTITVPAELTVVSNSVTTTTNGAATNSFFAGSPTTTTLAFGLTGTAANSVVTVEFDLTTPTAFAGIPQGSRVDTVYTLDFSSDVGTRQTPTVSKLQNLRVQEFQFSDPDSTIGDTTTLGGRFYKIDFPSALPDLSHTGISGLSASTGFSDGRPDIIYTFYLSTDSTLIRRPSTLADLTHFTLGADRTPLVGSGRIRVSYPALLFERTTQPFLHRRRQIARTPSSLSRRRPTTPSTMSTCSLTRHRIDSPL